MKCFSLIDEEIDEKEYERILEEKSISFIKENNLSEERIKEKYSKNEIQAIKNYSNPKGYPNYKVINEKKRNHIQLDINEQKSSLLLSKALRKTKYPENHIVYRSISLDDLSTCILFDNFGQPKLNEIVSFDSFVSTSLSLYIAKNYAKKSFKKIKILFKIKLKKDSEALYIKEISLVPEENEVLINENQNFLIENVNKNIDGFDYIFDLMIIQSIKK